jgi:hypothetical protein
MIASVLVGLALAAAPEPPAAPPEGARELAQQILTQGAALFDKRDAAAMAATYLEDGQLTLIGKDKETDAYKAETHRGRASIENTYARLFQDRPATAVSRNVVEAAHYVGPDILIIHGTFQLDTSTARDPVPFLQVRVKQDDAWRILSLQVFVLPEKESP